MSGFGISIRGAADVRRVQRLMMQRGKTHGRAEAAAMERVTLKLDRDVKKDGMTGQATVSAFWGKGGGQGDTIAVKTGHARRTIARRVFTKLLTVVGVVGSPLAYVRMHEFGGTVSGKPYLRIPTAWAKTPAGVDRYAGRSARTIPGTRVFRSRAGNLFVWETTSARAKAAGGPIPLYLLKTSVKLRARHMFRNALRKNKGYIQQQFFGAAATLVGK